MKKSLFSQKFVTQMGGGKLLLVSLLTSFTLFAQNQQNTLPTTGNVGVGTLTPNVKLQVNGSMKVDSSLTVKDTAVFEKQTRMKDKVVVEGDAVIQGTLKAKNNLKVEGTAKLEGDVKMTNLSTANNNDTTLLFVNQNGKVKSGSIGDLIDKIGNNPQDKSLLSNLIYTTLPPACFEGYMPIWYHKPEVLWTGSTGCPTRVGIMTDHPGEALDVKGTTQTVGLNVVDFKNGAYENIFYSKDVQGNGQASPKFMVLDGTETSLAFKGPNSPNTYGDWAIEYNTSAGGLNFWKPYPNIGGGTGTNGSNYFLFLRNDGHVGINTKDAKYQLSVEGTVGAREVHVNLDSWADFVFEKNYTLPTLKQTEKYINENGHLPNVPSAKEVTQNGLDLGEMNKILLQKVEELTLHLIQQEKVMQKQAQRITELEKTLENKKAVKP